MDPGVSHLINQGKVSAEAMSSALNLIVDFKILKF